MRNDYGVNVCRGKKRLKFKVGNKNYIRLLMLSLVYKQLRSNGKNL